MARRQHSVEELEKALRKYKGFISRAAASLNMTYTAFYKRMQKSPYLKEVGREEEEKLLDEAEFRLYKNITNDNQKAIEFVLRTKGHKRGYVEKRHFDFSGEMTVIGTGYPDNEE